MRLFRKKTFQERRKVKRTKRLARVRLLYRPQISHNYVVSRFSTFRGVSESFPNLISLCEWDEALYHITKNENTYK